jgi:hypothetical protein
MANAEKREKSRSAMLLLDCIELARVAFDSRFIKCHADQANDRRGCSMSCPTATQFSGDDLRTTESQTDAECGLPRHLFIRTPNDHSIHTEGAVQLLTVLYLQYYLTITLPYLSTSSPPAVVFLPPIHLSLFIRIEH